MCRMKNVSGFEWESIHDGKLPPIDEEVVFSSGIREFIGYMDPDMDIWECKENDDIEYHSNISDGYITHFRYY